MEVKLMFLFKFKKSPTFSTLKWYRREVQEKNLNIKTSSFSFPSISYFSDDSNTKTSGFLKAPEHFWWSCF